MRSWNKLTELITVRKRSCEKVMFLHLSVSHSVHRGVSASVHAGIHPLGRHPPPHGQTAPPFPQQTVTAADGRHPSGMNSCSVFFHMKQLTYLMLAESTLVQKAADVFKETASTPVFVTKATLEHPAK